MHARVPSAARPLAVPCCSLDRRSAVPGVSARASSTAGLSASNLTAAYREAGEWLRCSLRHPLPLFYMRMQLAASCKLPSALRHACTPPCHQPACPAPRAHTVGITPLHEGYAALLDSHVPVLAEEAQQCIVLMFPKAHPQQQAGGSAAAGAAAAPAAAVDASSAEVQGTVASLLAGIDSELLGLIEGIKPQAMLLCVPMLAATLSWRQRLAAQGPAVRPLVAVLAECQQRLTALLGKYFSDRAAAIQR